MGAFNTVREPYHTNIHTHGLHISGNPGGDDVMLQIEPGKDGIYTYKIPCDHAGMYTIFTYTYWCLLSPLFVVTSKSTCSMSEA
jgi:hypothetical protein